MSKAPLSKSVLITGCSEGGIGDALAEEFHANGLRVFATARNLKSIEHLKNIGITVLPLDVTSSSSIAEAVESVEAATAGTLDFLVNNSGVGYSMPILDSDLSIAREMFEVNVFGVVAIVQAFSPLLISSQGTIINIGSMNGFAPIPWSGLYNASKAAVNHLTDILRQEMAPFGVKVILVITGVVKTNFFKNETLPGNSLYLPAKVTIEQILSGASLAKYEADRVEYAKVVVANAVRRDPKVRQWAGGIVTMMWNAGIFLTTGLWDRMFKAQFGLVEMTRKLSLQV